MTLAALAQLADAIPFCEHDTAVLDDGDGDAGDVERLARALDHWIDVVLRGRLREARTEESGEILIPEQLRIDIPLGESAAARHQLDGIHARRAAARSGPRRRRPAACRPAAGAVALPISSVISPFTASRCSKSGADFGRRAAQELLVNLGQLARHDDRARAQDLLDGFQRFQNAVRRLVEDQRRLLLGDGFQRLLALPRLVRQEAAEVEGVGGQTRTRPAR